MSLFIYEVKVNLNIFVGKEWFELKVTKHEAQERGKSVFFDGKRIPKDQIGIPSNKDMHNNSNAIAFITFVHEEGLEEAKVKTLASVRELAEKKLQEMIQLVELSKKTPSEKFRDNTVD